MRLSAYRYYHIESEVNTENGEDSQPPIIASGKPDPILENDVNSGDALHEKGKIHENDLSSTLSGIIALDDCGDKEKVRLKSVRKIKEDESPPEKHSDIPTSASAFGVY